LCAAVIRDEVSARQRANNAKRRSIKNARPSHRPRHSNSTEKTLQTFAKQGLATIPFPCVPSFAKVGNLGKLIRTYEFYAKTGDEFPQNGQNSRSFA
jgi:hypothetical protein